MKLSRTVAYALQATLLLAKDTSRMPVACSKLAVEGKMPERFLLQILRNLVNHGLLRSTPHFPGKAKRVIHLFMNGGPSHVDTFDPKPLAGQVRRQAAADGKPAHRAQDRRRVSLAVQVPEVRRERHRGQRAVPAHARHIDDIAVIRSMHADVPNHEPSLLLMNCGEARLVRPSMGSWVTYGLGTENQNLPGFVAMCPGGYPITGDAELAGGVPARRLPGHVHRHAAHRFEKLIENVRNQMASPREAAAQLDLLAKLNRLHQSSAATTRRWRPASSRSSWPTACR
jgi:hypothetical protein